MTEQNLNTIKILAVEDSPVFAKAITAMIEFSDSNVFVSLAANLEQALCLLEKGGIDLILLDLQLPDSEGLDTLRRMHAAAEHTPIVVMTGEDDESKALEALKLGAQDYLLKADVNARSLQRTLSYALERSQRQSLEIERLHLYQQREEFMATLTHDLKNPLIGANRILELLANERLGPQNTEQKRLLQKLHGSNNTLLAMIRNMVEVYRYEKDINVLYKEHTDLVKVIQVYLSEVLFLAESKQIEIEAHLPPVVPLVLADKMSMRRVVQNLIENAIKFTPEGGKITVRMWRDERDMLHFQVEDSGPGIAPEEKPILFQRFSQGRLGKAYSPGTGLGLYLCRQIVEAHQGIIDCRNSENSGATFTVSLPIAASA